MRAAPVLALLLVSQTASADNTPEDAVAFIEVRVRDAFTHACMKPTHGSGFLYDIDGYILTARHVLQREGADQADLCLTVAFRDRNSTSYPAEPIKCSEDKNKDLCILKIASSAVRAANITVPF